MILIKPLSDKTNETNGKKKFKVYIEINPY